MLAASFNDVVKIFNFTLAQVSQTLSKPRDKPESTTDVTKLGTRRDRVCKVLFSNSPRGSKVPIVFRVEDCKDLKARNRQELIAKNSTHAAKSRGAHRGKESL